MSDSIIVELDNSVAAKTYAANAANSAVAAANSVSIDKTLTISGAPADAGAVGNDIKNTLSGLGATRNILRNGVPITDEYILKNIAIDATGNEQSNNANVSTQFIPIYGLKSLTLKYNSTKNIIASGFYFYTKNKTFITYCIS